MVKNGRLINFYKLSIDQVFSCDTLARMKNLLGIYVFGLAGISMSAFGAVGEYNEATNTYHQSDYSDLYDDEYQSGLSYSESEVSTFSSSDSKGKIPLLSQTYYEYMGGMDCREGVGDIDVQQWMLDVNLWKATLGGWEVSATTSFRASWFNGEGAEHLDIDRLYTIWLQANASCRVWNKTKLMLGLTPQVSTDFDTWTHHNIYVGAYAMFAGQLNDKVSYGVGLAYSPQYGSFSFLPAGYFDWDTGNNWHLRLKGSRLSYTQHIGGFQWGPFFSVESGTWTVKHSRRVRQFQWLSCVAGVGVDCSLGNWRGYQPRLMADLGFTFANSGTIRTSNGNHELERYHYDPGLYLRVGMYFNF